MAQKVEKATITLDVMRIDNKTYFIGKYGIMSRVPESAMSVIVELEVAMNEILRTKNKTQQND